MLSGPFGPFGSSKRMLVTLGDCALVSWVARCQGEMGVPGARVSGGVLGVLDERLIDQQGFRTNVESFEG